MLTFVNPAQLFGHDKNQAPALPAPQDRFLRPDIVAVENYNVCKNATK
jgi:hypothetical protein